MYSLLRKFNVKNFSPQFNNITFGRFDTLKCFYSKSQGKSSSGCQGEQQSGGSSPVARISFSQIIEEAINKQICCELHASYNFLAMASYFGRTEIGMPGAKGFFRAQALEEHGHAMKLIDYQCSRGGNVRFGNIEAPVKERWDSILDALEMSLDIETKNIEKLYDLGRLALDEGDSPTQDWLTCNIIREELEHVHFMGMLMAKAKIVCEQGIGEFLMDQYLVQKYSPNEKN